MTFGEQLRNEMHLFLSRRHDYSLRKLSFCTGLLGLGTISVTVGTDQFAVPALLYLVPFIAIAFDLYIVAEDYRVKRAGVFLRRLAVHADADERAYETFVGDSANHAAPLTFAVVTGIMLGLSAFVLWATSPHKVVFFLWLAVVLLIDGLLVARVAGARAALLTKEVFAPPGRDSRDSPMGDTPISRVQEA